MKNNGDLSKLFGSQPEDFFFEMGHGTCNDWVGHPVNSFRGFALAQLVKATQQLGDCKMLMVVQVKKDFIACHCFKVDEVMNWRQLILEKSSTNSFTKLDSRFFWLLAMAFRQTEFQVFRFGQDHPVSVCSNSMHLESGCKIECCNGGKHHI